jgi:ABC-type transport system involved in multi-copper enzyme maturation permease subunit
VELWTGLMAFFLGFLPAALAAWGVGFEEASDTWKALLVRRPSRGGFLGAKLVAFLCWCALLLAFTFALCAGLSALLGLFAPAQAGAGAEAAPDLFGLLEHVLRVLSLTPLVVLVALESKGNGTLAGTLVGVIGPFAVAMAALWEWQLLNRATPVFAAKALALRLRQGPGPAAAADALVGKGFGAWAAAAVLVAWFAVALAVALVRFSRRDVVSRAL